MKNKIIFPAAAALLLFIVGGCSLFFSETVDPYLEISDPSPSPGTFRDLIEIDPDSENSLTAESADWYKDATVYHIWINAFDRHDGAVDHNNSRVGTIKGITERLDYLQELGVNTLWLSPFFKGDSPDYNLHLYDTTDHYMVDPRFGTKDDVDELLKQAHGRNMRLIFDYVPNHVSNNHRWFRESADRNTDYDDYFIWVTRQITSPGPWGQNVWHPHRNGLFYYGVFYGGMPDINFRSQRAKDAITNVALYWLNRGFDGMRIDAVKYLYEAGERTSGRYEDRPETFAFFVALRELLDSYGTHPSGSYHKFMVAENWTENRSSLERYMVSGGNPAFHMTLDFPFAYAAASGNTEGLEHHWNWVTDALHSNGWMGAFTTNHDNVVNRMGDSPRARAAASAMLTGPGTPFIYYGNEIGMEDADEFEGGHHADRRHRQPFDWNAQIQQQDSVGSMLEHHRGLIQQRRNRVSLRRGNLARVDAGSADVLAFRREYGEESSLVVINFANADREIEINLTEVTITEKWVAYGLDGALSVSGGVLSGTMPAGTAAIYDL